MTARVSVQQQGERGRGLMARRLASIPVPLLCLLPGLLAAWLYWPVLRLPNMYDTLLHTQLAEGLTFSSVWLPDDRFGFYRPLVFLPLVIIRSLTGGYPAVLLQGLNLIQHAVNASLTAGLAWRITGRRWPALTAGAFLAAFPFGYQALAIYGNNAYLTISGLLLLGLFLWLSERKGSAAALALVQLAALLVHEIGVLLLPLIVLLELVRPNSAPQWKAGKYRRLFQKAAPSLVVLGVYLVFYMALPRGGGPQLDFGGNEPWPKLLLFMQTAAYPFVWLAHRLPDWSAVSVILSGVVLTGLMAVWSWWRSHRGRVLLLSGLGWWLLASLLVAVTLPTYYIADGARLLYPGGVGLALFWAGITVIDRERLRPENGAGGKITLDQRGVSFLPLLFSAGTVVILITSALFIRQMIAYYRAVGEPVAVLTGVLGRQPAADGVLWVNPPQWVSPPRNTYATGTELAPLLGSHLFASELILANGGGERPVTVLLAPELQVETLYHFGVYGLTAVEQIEMEALTAQVTHVFVTGYQEDGPLTRSSGRIEKSGELDGDKGTLGPYRLLAARAAACEDDIRVELTLTTAAEPPPTISLFVQALADDGRLLVQQDGPPLGIPAARLVWSEGAAVVERRVLGTDEGEPAVVLIGAYDFATGERFAAFDTAGEPLIDNALRLPLDDGAELCVETP